MSEGPTAEEHTACSEDRALDINVAACSLLWGNPGGERFIPWLRSVKESGYDGIAGFAHWGWQDYIGDPELFGAVVAAEGLSVASVITDIHADFDQYRRVCDFMAVLGCHHLVCLGGKGREAGDFTALANLLNHIGEIAAPRGIRAVYHNHTATTGETFEDMDRLLAHTDPQKLSVMCDVGHATKDFVNQPVRDRAALFLDKYWDRLDFIELKDWHPDTNLDTPLGEGLCDYGAVFSLLKDRGYSGWLTVEQNGARRGRQPDECARISREFIREGLGV